MAGRVGGATTADLHDWGTVPQRGFLAGRITGAVNWLGTDGHLDGLLVTELAEPFGVETCRWHRELVAKTHSARSAKHVKKPCPRCRLYTLWEEIGQEYIRCINKDCNRMMTRDELNQAGAAASAEHRPLDLRNAAVTCAASGTRMPWPWPGLSSCPRG